MNRLIAIVGIISYVVIGFSILKLLGFTKKRSLLENSAFSFGVGVGLISFEMFIYSILRIQWSNVLLLTPWLIPTFFAFKNTKLKLSRIFSNYKFVDYLLFILILILLAFTFFEANIRPLYAWDGIASWVLKGKVFYFDGFLNSNFLALIKDSHPYIISLGNTYIFNLLGTPDDRSVQIFYYAFYFFLALLFYSSLKKQMGIRRSLIFTFLILSTQNLIRHGGRYEAGYADLALGFYIFSTLLILIEYLKKQSYKILYVLLLLTAITSLVKEEGMFFSYLIFLIILILQVKKRNFKGFFYWIIGLAPLVGWEVFEYYNRIPFHYYYTQFNIQIFRAPVVAKYMFLEFLNIQNWNLLWIFFLIGILYSIKNRKTNLIYLIILYQLFIYFLVFLISPQQPQLHVPNAIDRLLLHLAPIALYITVLSVNNAMRSPFKRSDKID